MTGSYILNSYIVIDGEHRIFVSTIFKALLRENHASYPKSKVTILISGINNFFEKNFDPPL